MDGLATDAAAAQPGTHAAARQLAIRQRGTQPDRPRGWAGLLRALLLGAVLSSALPAGMAAAQISPFRQAVAEQAAGTEALQAFYRSRDYAPLWTGKADAARRAALFAALDQVAAHGLPPARYQAETLRSDLRNLRSESDLGRLEVALSRVLLTYARDVQTGMLEPREIDAGILRDIPRRDPLAILRGLAGAENPAAYLATLPPQTAEYARLMKAKLGLEARRQAGGWGATVPAPSLAPGDSGPAVIALRNRMIAMEYLPRSASAGYDAALARAVQAFQFDTGLDADGTAGPGTMTEINRPVEDRLQAVIVAMERERWMNMPLGARHIRVNLADFTARIVDDGKITFETSAIIGKNTADRRTPEFSDQMEYLVINPSWNVPRSITVNEYLPMLQRNPNAAGQLIITDRSGREINRGAVDFTQFTARTFPFSMRQPPSDSNALGLVKFMFPNSNNIYLHDTPQKELFAKEVRDFSHGCIRLREPFAFAYALLARQTDDPQGLFQSLLATGKETPVTLDVSIPVHLDYRTAFGTAKGRINYRRDIYGRDARLFEAMAAAGVELQGGAG